MNHSLTVCLSQLTNAFLRESNLQLKVTTVTENNSTKAPGSHLCLLPALATDGWLCLLDTPGLLPVLPSLFLILRPFNHFKSPASPISTQAFPMKLRCVCVISCNGLWWSMDWRGQAGGKVTAFPPTLIWNEISEVWFVEGNNIVEQHVQSDCPFDKVSGIKLAVNSDGSVAFSESKL